MKCHITATIDEKVVETLRKIGGEERRSLSNVLESAAIEFVERRRASASIVTSAGKFGGTFSRRETHARKRR